MFTQTHFTMIRKEMNQNAEYVYASNGAAGLCMHAMF